MTRRRFLLGAVGAALAARAPALAAGWTKLGSLRINVSNGQYSDTELLGMPGNTHVYSRVRIGVRGSPLLIHEIAVVYDHGFNDAIALHKVLADGEFFTSEPLRAGDRPQREISIIHEKLKSATAPTYIDVYGS